MKVKALCSRTRSGMVWGGGGRDGGGGEGDRPCVFVAWPVIVFQGAVLEHGGGDVVGV